MENKMENKKSIPGMKTCCVCGRDFPLLVENRYTARDPEKSGAPASLVGSAEVNLFDATDCPHCGCQNILQPRKRNDAISELECLAVDDDEEETLTRDQAELKIRDLLDEVRKVHKKYNPNANYLTAVMYGKYYVQFNNSYWREDSNHPINYTRED